jgi:hypothetical protein
LRLCPNQLAVPVLSRHFNFKYTLPNMTPNGL